MSPSIMVAIVKHIRFVNLSGFMKSAPVSKGGEGWFGEEEEKGSAFD